ASTCSDLFHILGISPVYLAQFDIMRLLVRTLTHAPDTNFCVTRILVITVWIYRKSEKPMTEAPHRKRASEQIDISRRSGGERITPG
ncbi:MAG: hypothetical protein AB1457_17965, partial [Chloroflexota bacterium]